MLKSHPLNWRIENKYNIVNRNEDNPIFYCISVGSLDDMWLASLIPETMILSFTSYHYSNNEVYRFKVDSIEDASEIVLKFAKGMDRLSDLHDTIYWNKDIIK